MTYKSLGPLDPTHRHFGQLSQICLFFTTYLFFSRFLSVFDSLIVSKRKLEQLTLKSILYLLQSLLESMARVEKALGGSLWESATMAGAALDALPLWPRTNKSHTFPTMT